MKSTSFRDLPISYNKKFVITINKLFQENMIFTINGRKFYTSIPKNSSWMHVTLHEGMVCTVKKEKYYSGNREYAKLTLIEYYKDSYFEEENNYKETASYSSQTKYYELLECDIDATFEIIKSNYRRLIRAYHYDTLVSKGLPADMLEYAQNKAKLINEAYDVLKNKKY
ncbi:MAG: DnaJ like chaperone protein [Campylobacterota bacterium]|nr:DnaJ like chaperone protein [Campylobacterota bacterium]